MDTVTAKAAIVRLQDESKNARCQSREGETIQCGMACAVKVAESETLPLTQRGPEHEIPPAGLIDQLFETFDYGFDQILHGQHTSAETCSRQRRQELIESTPSQRRTRGVEMSVRKSLIVL